MDLVDLGPDDPRFWRDALPVLRELRRHLTETSAQAVYDEGHPQGLRFTAVYVDGRCVAVAGWRVVATMVAGRKLYVDDLVTTDTHRGQGVGSFLLDALVQRAAQSGCTALDLDSGNQRADAHRFYRRQGLQETAVHFARILT